MKLGDYVAGKTFFGYIKKIYSTGDYLLGVLRTHEHNASQFIPDKIRQAHEIHFAQKEDFDRFNIHYPQS